jgi:sensor histidine kinase regulating citrate/malate metabolism
VGGKPARELRDQGAGVALNEQERLFSQGFSTKKSAGGFGLHYCANTMKDIGGDIKITSKGPDQGAAVTLIFVPAEKEGPYVSSMSAFSG